MTRRRPHHDNLRVGDVAGSAIGFAAIHVNDAGRRSYADDFHGRRSAANIHDRTIKLRVRRCDTGGRQREGKEKSFHNIGNDAAGDRKFKKSHLSCINFMEQR